MTTFSKTGFKTLKYNSFRPHYPPSFYKILESYVGVDGPLSKAIDLGCGSGVATYPLLNFTKEVVGVDLSELMTETANSLKVGRLKDLGIEDPAVIKFKTGSVEDFVANPDSDTQPGTFDLITAAQCIHWFQDYDLFFANTAKLLKKQGTLAYWYYLDPIISNYNQADADPLKEEKLARAQNIYNKYVYGDEYLGPYWEQPGRDILKNGLAAVNEAIPHSLYTGVKIKNFSPEFSNPAPGPDDLQLVKQNITLQDLANYLGTYSSYHNFKEATGDKDNLIELYIKELEDEFGWDRNTTKIDLTYSSGYTFMKTM